jgi:hypothetical protein
MTGGRLWVMHFSWFCSVVESKHVGLLLAARVMSGARGSKLSVTLGTPCMAPSVVPEWP